MTATSAIILICIGLALAAGYTREWNDDSLRRYNPKKKRRNVYKR